MHAKNDRKKATTLLKRCGPQIWLCLFTFRPITLKQLKSLTLIGKFSCLGGLYVTHRNMVRKVPGSVRDLCFLFCIVFVQCGFTFCPKHIKYHDILQFLLQYYVI